MNRLFFASLLLCACGASPDEADDLASLVPDTAVKADSLKPAGAFEITATKLRTDDVVYLNLLPPNGQNQSPWVWNRCFDTPCSQFIPQDGNYSFYKSASGTKYIKFSMNGKVGDVYAYTLKGQTLKLRHANSSRWFTLTGFSDEAACEESGGSFGGDDACDCSALGKGAFNTDPVFQPGMGGCFLIPQSGEEMCDSTGGSYTDDDNNLVGSFCDCGARKYFASGQGCVAVP